MLAHYLNNLSHHAYLLVGDREELLKELPEVLKNALDFDREGNPDYSEILCDLFDVEHARALKESASQRRIGEARVFVISFSRLLHEAQNTLLKLLEEPGERVYFFLIAERADSFAPTLRSRLVIIDARKKKEDAWVKNFLKKSKAERLETIKSIIERGDRSEALSFLNGLEYELSRDAMVKINHPQIFKDIFKARSYLSDRAPSLKMILEHIAVTI